ncbi:MAG: hypothetical protein ACM31N_03895 [Deltaproteobacteria bacterium]
MTESIEPVNGKSPSSSSPPHDPPFTICGWEAGGPNAFAAVASSLSPASPEGTRKVPPEGRTAKEQGSRSPPSSAIKTSADHWAAEDLTEIFLQVYRIDASVNAWM